MGWWIGWLKPWQVTGERSEREEKNRLVGGRAGGSLACRGPWAGTHGP